MAAVNRVAPRIVGGRRARTLRALVAGRGRWRGRRPAGWAAAGRRRRRCDLDLTTRWTVLRAAVAVSRAGRWCREVRGCLFSAAFSAAATMGSGWELGAAVCAGRHAAGRRRVAAAGGAGECGSAGVGRRGSA
ncbi:proline-rich receptor-like protein kinase PERK1 [Gracilaria domingensis]|nr:proline-rich receptor-like protein kinase PERK1 [Gracilaria domingensis]